MKIVFAKHGSRLTHRRGWFELADDNSYVVSQRDTFRRVVGVPFSEYDDLVRDEVVTDTESPDFLAVIKAEKERHGRYDSRYLYDLAKALGLAKLVGNEKFNRAWPGVNNAQQQADTGRAVHGTTYFYECPEWGMKWEE